MDAEAIVWLVFIGIWFIGGILKQIKQVKEQRPGQPGSQPQVRRETPRPAPRAESDDPMIQLLRQLGGQAEARPQKPPPPPPTPVPTLLKSVPMAQQVRVAREARADVASANATKKAANTELKLQSVAAAAARSRVPGALARSIQRQLRDPQGARRAILLQEILGKPPGLQGAPAKR